MLVELYVVIGLINILANMKDFNIPNTPELRDLRVRRSAYESRPYGANNKPENTKHGIKRIFNGEYFKERTKRSYPGYQQAGYVNQVNTSWNGAATYPGYYNGNAMNTPGSNGYNAVGRNNYSAGGYYVYPGSSYPVYYQYRNNTYQFYVAYPNATYRSNNPNTGNNLYPGNNNANYKPNMYSPFNNTGYGYPPPGSITPGYNATAVTSTTPRIDKSCIICNIGCPQFMKRIGFLCKPDTDDDYD